MIQNVISSSNSSSSSNGSGSGSVVLLHAQIIDD